MSSIFARRSEVAMPSLDVSTEVHFVSKCNIPHLALSGCRWEDHFSDDLFRSFPGANYPLIMRQLKG